MKEVWKEHRPLRIGPARAPLRGRFLFRGRGGLTGVGCRGALAGGAFPRRSRVIRPHHRGRWAGAPGLALGACGPASVGTGNATDMPRLVMVRWISRST